MAEVFLDRITYLEKEVAQLNDKVDKLQEQVAEMIEEKRHNRAQGAPFQGTRLDR